MSEMPEDIMNTALEAIEGWIPDARRNVVTKLVATALLAERLAATADERERCAKVAEKQADLSQTNDYDMGWCRSAMVIGDEIRKGE